MTKGTGSKILAIDQDLTSGEPYVRGSSGLDV